jgi:hypothetical protein
MNPDPTNPYYQVAVERRRLAERAERERRAALHRRAKARRAKAKCGGRR